MESTPFLLALGLGAWFVPGDHELYDALDGSHRSIGTAGSFELRGSFVPHDAAHLELSGSLARGREATLTSFSPQLNLGWTVTSMELRPGLALGVSRHTVRGPTLGQDADWGRHAGLNLAVPLDEDWGFRVDARRTKMSAAADGTTHHHAITLSMTRSL